MVGDEYKSNMVLGKENRRTRYELCKKQVTEEGGPQTGIDEEVRCESQILLRCRYTVEGGVSAPLNKAVLWRILLPTH